MREASPLVWLALVPALPLLTHAIMALKYWGRMKEVISEEVMQRDTHRSMITALAGFSFTALLGLVVMQGVSALGLEPAILCLLWSFLSYLVALNLQGYKFNRLRDLVSDAMMESASLALLWAVSMILWVIDVSWVCKVLVPLASGITWLVNHYIRLNYTSQFLSSNGASGKPEKKEV